MLDIITIKEVKIKIGEWCKQKRQSYELSQEGLAAALDMSRITIVKVESGKNVTTGSVQKAKDAGATDTEIHDTVLIAALFCLYNRYVDGLSTVTPTDPAFYKGLGERLKNHGYNRLPEGYDHLKNKQ